MTAVQDDDDEIQYLYTAPREEILCQICNENLDPLKVEERESHYAAHFLEDEENASLSTPPLDLEVQEQTPPSGSGPSPAKGKGPEETPSGDSFWHPFMHCEPPSNFSPGLIPVLRVLLTRLGKEGAIQRAVLCSEWTTHIRGQGVDRFWTCGYRNFLMACTALATQKEQDTYLPMLLSDPTCGPGVRNLQRWIEAAWQAGYDAEGANQLRHKLVGTGKWIGTGEIHVAFTHKGVPSMLVDFPQGAASKGTATALSNWVVKYFSAPALAHPSASPGTPNALNLLRDPGSVTASQKMPLILQHKGHSRLIVGYQISRGGVTSLLMFDPARSVAEKTRKAGLAFHYQMLNPSGASAQPPSSSQNASSSQRSLPTIFGKLLQVARPTKRSRGTNASDAISIDDDDSVKHIAKRPKGGQHPVEHIVVVDDDDDEGKAKSSTVLSPPSPSKSERVPREIDQLDPQKVVDFFSVNSSKLSKYDQYQILFFPLTAPWSPDERAQHREVQAAQVVQS